MKCLYALALVFLFGAPASAQTVNSRQSLPTAVYETAKGTWTTAAVLISSHNTGGAIQVDATTLLNRTELSIQNLDPTANLWCGERSNVGSFRGVRIIPNGYWTIKIPAYKSDGATALKVYCANDGAVGQSTATLVQVAPLF